MTTDITDELSLRVGRMRVPAYMYSQTLYVDYTRNFAKLPKEIYIAVPFTNYDGVELSYTKSFDNYVLNLLLGASNESNYDNVAETGAYGTIVTGFSIKDIRLAALSVENEDFLLRGAYAKGKLTIWGNPYIDELFNSLKSPILPFLGVTNGEEIYYNALKFSNNISPSFIS